MKWFILFPMYFIVISIGYSQTNIVGIHQLVDVNKDEFSRQENAKNNQALVNANEVVNKTQLAKLQNKYAELQDRYATLGIAIDVAKIGIKATPIVNNIIKHQAEIIKHAGDHPILLSIAIESELTFVDRSHRLTNYLIGLVAVIGDINQMKPSDRMILFDHILVELRTLDRIARDLATSMRYTSWRSLLRSQNPFQDFIDKDRAIIEDIMRTVKFY